MPLSFWFFLGVCIFSFVPVLKDHGESWREYLASTGKEKRLAALLVFAIWAVPIFTAIGTIITGVEAVTSGKENAALHKLAAEANERSKQLESTNLALRKEVLELQSELMRVDLTAQPVFSVEASAMVRLNTNQQINPLLTKPFSATLMFRRSTEKIESVGAVFLQADDVRQFDRELFLDLRWMDFMKRIVGGQPHETASQLIKELNGGFLTIPALVNGLAIVDSEITLTLNGSVHKTFKVSKQEADGVPAFRLVPLESK